jgi:hypothetical protein
MINEVNIISKELKELKEKYQSTDKLKILYIEISTDDVKTFKGINNIEGIPLQASMITKDYKGLTSGSCCIVCDGIKKYFSLNGYKL